jgi:type VI secretion system protein ImpF
MTELSSAERLQPSLLDRLIDDEPERRDEPLEARVFNRQRLRAAVLRDLSWLFNATNAGWRIDAERFPAAHASVLNFGLPCLSGNFASSVDVVTLEQSIRDAIVQFEPRIAPDSLEIEPVLDRPVLELHNQIALVIHGLLWAQPAPLEIALHTQIDLEEGGITVTELRR